LVCFIMKTKTDSGWIAKIMVISMLVSMAFTLASTKILGSAGYVMAFLVLAVFILLGIVFDIIGVSVTAASRAPFHSMAAKKEPGAAEALKLIRSAEKVSSICNDVVGDISGIISGTTSALVVAKLTADLSTENILIQLGISALVTGATIGGKAFGKTLALRNSTKIVLDVGKLIHIKNRIIVLIPKRNRTKNPVKKP
jgi:CBS domain containing-hemolysin-like protein